MDQISAPTLSRVKKILFLVCLMPFASLFAGAALKTLGPDPVIEITHTTGIWALNLVFATLAFTPIRKLTGWHWILRLRRSVALFAFFYACLHFLAFLVFDHFFDWNDIARDIVKRPYVTAGFLSFALMIPLAVSSTNAMIKRMGGRNWKALHRVSYVVAASAVVHYFWLVKADINVPSLYALILLGMLGARLIDSPRMSHRHANHAGGGSPLASGLSGSASVSLPLPMTTQPPPRHEGSNAILNAVAAKPARNQSGGNNGNSHPAPAGPAQDRITGLPE